MKALILAGGKGTRLRPLTVYTPKPIVPVINRPFLLYQLETLARAGVSDVTLSLSYQPNKIEEVLSQGTEPEVDLSFVTEPTALGTAGAYRYAVTDESTATVVLNGDILTDLDITKMIEFHKTNGAAVTIALARVKDPSNYGLVETDASGRVQSFIEKPKRGDSTLPEPAANTINAGIYILEPEVLKLIPKGENASFEYGIFPKALETKLPFFGYVLDEGDYWRDIGTPGSYLSAQLDILDGKVRIDADTGSSGAEVSQTAMIERSVIGEGCVIKPNARIVRSVIGPGVHVEERAVIENSVIWPHSRISTLAELTMCVVGRGCHVGRNAVIREGSVLGDKSVVTDYSVV